MPRPGPRTTNKYSDRFKATAVRLSELPGVAVQDVAESLYIHPFMSVTNWGGYWEGKLSADGSTLEGQWTQGGLTSPLVLKKVATQ